MDDLLSEFLTETNENIAVLDVELVRLEQNRQDPDLLSNIFRLVHTIKGTCGFLGLPRLEAVAHAGENVLGKFRDGELEVSPAAVTLILESLDQIKAILAHLEKTEAEPEGDDADLIARLNAAAAGQFEGSAEGAPEDPGLDAVAVVMAQGEPEPESEPEPAPAPTLAEPLPAAAPAPAPAKVEAAPAAEAAEAHRESAVASQSIRVHVDLLENLMTTVSELVLTRNQLLQILREQKESDFGAPLQRLNQVVSELQEGVMKTRMQPIGNAWSKLPRIVRDISHEMGKKIELDMRGAETELDRQVLELIKDPLTHMVRNSCDHGIEAPADRRQAGKDETGTIRLNAYHEGGHIIIEIADDGRGLDVGKIKAKALANGLATEAELESLSEQQLYQFIFKAGFSTAAQVTSVSGRGVGMDVVRTNIERIGGTVELKSTEGRGSIFIIKIPLTLAIVSALIIESAGERFAIPQISVLELVRATADGDHRIERIKGTPVLRLRNRLLPLVSLRKLLQLDDDSATTEDSEAFIVVAQVGTYTFGIIVDRVFDTEEIVVKPVSPVIRHIELFSGNTILGDGSVIMILDPNGIAASTGELTLADHDHDAETSRSRRNAAVAGDERTALLLFRAGEGAPRAVPLALVARLENVAVETIEYSNGAPVVQYRESLMPLIAFESMGAPRDEGRQPVLVFADDQRSMGLMVDEIIDIVEDEVQVQLAAERPGLLGSAVIAGKATDVIDVGYYLTQAYHDWFSAEGERTAFGDEDHGPQRVLLVDDSPFFRNMITPLLTVAGYRVTSVESAAEALDLCEGGAEFDVIVSDIEMPGMTGFEFASRLRADSRFAHTPVVALSSHATPADLDRGRDVGFDDYVVKFDREALLSSLSQTLADAREDQMRGAA